MLKKSKLRYASALFASVLILSMTSCGDPPAPVESSEPSQVSSEAPASQSETSQAEAEQTEVDTANLTFQQAPMLDSAGLPPVEERLPESPLVVPPQIEIGQYGGELNLGMLGPGDMATNYWSFINEPLVKWDRAGTGIIPNVAESWSIEDDGKTYVFKLRKSTKWSDGTPLSTDDIMFFYNDLMLNTTLTPTIPKWLTSGGKPAVFEQVDDLTFKVKFETVNSTFLENMAFNGDMPTTGVNQILRPKHYLSQFHPSYASEEELKAKAKEAGVDSWNELFQLLGTSSENPDLPVLAAWKPTDRLAGKTVQTLERNPYYFKVDPEGRQLPYIDRLQVNIVENAEALIAKVLSGEINYDVGHITLPNYPMMKENEELGDYRALLWEKAVGAQLGIWPNLNHQDPTLRELFNQKDFRIALSYAINRKQINDICFMGLAQERHATIFEESPYYTEGLAELYADFDPDKANQMLDAVGLDQKGADGFRLLPDGRPLVINIEYPAHNEFGSFEDMLELVKKDWANVGVNLILKVIDRTLYETRALSTDPDAIIWAFPRGMHPLIEPNFLFPFRTGKFSGAHAYATWYSTGGAEGEKPDGDILKCMELYDQFLVTVDDTERTKIGQEIVKISAENAWCIGSVGKAPTVEAIGNDVGNFPENGLHEWVLLNLAHVCPEQYYIKS